jgi:hypothetical protein
MILRKGLSRMSVFGTLDNDISDQTHLIVLQTQRKTIINFYNRLTELNRSSVFIQYNIVNNFPALNLLNIVCFFFTNYDKYTINSVKYDFFLYFFVFKSKTFSNKNQDLP